MLGPAELVPAVDEMDNGGETGQELRFHQSGVSSADDGDFPVPEKGPVARGAVRNAAADELGLVGLVEAPVLGACRDDHRARRVLRFAAADEPAVAVLPDLPRLVGLELGAEPDRLFVEVLHQIKGDEAFGKAGVILDPVRDQNLAARDRFLEDQGVQPGAAGIQRGGEAGRPRADNDDVELSRH